MLRASGNLLETMATWGPAAPRQRVFGPGECWAFRRGRPHMVEERESPLRCAHLAPEDGAISICVPMMAQGDNLGILQLNFSSIDDQEPAEDNRLESTRARLAVALAEHIGLALANLRLREALRNQSIVDPLTGLFNRRYLEQTLERECRRAVRADGPLSVIMLDVDHFKRFNDAWGHEGGDAVLKELAGLLRRILPRRRCLLPVRGRGIRHRACGRVAHSGAGARGSSCGGRWASSPCGFAERRWLPSRYRSGWRRCRTTA